jgi:3-methylcrotonyl-CoA carboxylase alpha subunit
MEAMKMEHTLKAPTDGRVERFPYPVGTLVEENTVLVDFVPEGA